MKNKRIYLDYAAATPIDEEVARAMNEVEGNFANPSAQYASARESKLVLEKARKDVAMFLHANSVEIIFTSGASESNNMAILGIAGAFGEGRIISIQTEHSSVASPLQQLAEVGFEVVYCPVDKYGQINLDEFRRLLTKNTILVSISYANSELGTIQPITKIGRIVSEFNTVKGADVKFHTDASAAPLTLACDVARLGVDSLSLGGAKLYGPHGIGVLYVKRGLSIEPIQFGGGQQLGLKPGTEPVTLAVGMAKALNIAVSRRSEIIGLFGALREELTKQLGQTDLDLVLNGHPKAGLLNIINISLPGFNGEDLVALLDSRGVEVSTGAACEASNEEPSKTLLAVGVSKELAQASLRISFGVNTTASDVRMLVKVLSDIIQPK